MNRNGFGPCMEVSMTDDPEAWERGHTFFAVAMTIEKAKEALAKVQGSCLVKNEEDYYFPLKGLKEGKPFEVVYER